MEHLLKNIQDQLTESARVKELIRDNYSRDILFTTEVMIKCLKSGGKLLICGNGGSASDAQHFAAEMVCRFTKERGALPSIALTTDTSILTAIANDYSFNDIFSRQVEALGAQNDILIAISTSGRSENVNRAVTAAKAKNIQCIALTGKDGGTLADLADYKIIVPADTAKRIQEGHITIIHIWCELIENAMFPDC